MKFTVGFERIKKFALYLLPATCYLLSVCGNPLMEKELEPLVKERERLPDVVVTPSAATIMPGDSLQFSAKVNFTDNQAVTWSVLGHSGATTIDDEGLLTVDDDEEVDTMLTVRATSVEDPAKSGAAAVTIVAPDIVPSITITANPESVTVTEGNINDTLSVSAIVTPTATPTYQWYSTNTDSNDDGTLIPSATSANFNIPDDLTEGIYYYFCEVSAEGAEPVRSEVAVVTVNDLIHAKQPVIETQPTGGSFYQNADITLIVEASVEDDGDLSYQWYSNTTESNSGGTLIGGATEATYTPSTETIGVFYYYVIVTNTNNEVNGNKTVGRSSNVVVVTITQAPLSTIVQITEYLADQPGGDVDNPVPVPLPLALQLTADNWQAVLEAIAEADKFVELDLSECTPSTSSSGGGLRANGTFDANINIPDGKDKIVSLVLPDVATTVQGTSSTTEDRMYFTYLKSVSGEGITNIANDAFRYCSELEEVNFPEALTIGIRSFFKTSLKEAIFPKVTSIGTYTFQDCENLTTISFPEAINIGIEAFNGCRLLEEAIFPKVTSIGQYTFASCSMLKKADFQEVLTIGLFAFAGCRLLEEAIFPKVTSIGNTAFQNCESLINVSFPEVTDIAGNAFNRCIKLKKAIFPLVTNIGLNAFGYCSELEEVYIPEIISIGNSVFQYTDSTSLTITMGSNAPTVGTGIFGSVTGKLVTVKVPVEAEDDYGSNPINTTDQNWGNAFRGMGWNPDNEDWETNGFYGTSTVNANVTLVIEYE